MLKDTSMSYEEIYSQRYRSIKMGENWINSLKYRAFFVLIHGFEFDRGALALMQGAGLGKLAPNLLLLGYKENWNKTKPDKTKSYVNIIQHAIKEQLAVAIFRLASNARLPKGSPPSYSDKVVQLPSDNKRNEMLDALDSDTDIVEGTTSETFTKDNTTPMIQQKEASKLHLATSLTNMPKPFEINEGQDVDVWWLYDDGGLNILLSYILAKRRTGGGKETLRIFALAKERYKEEDAKKHIEYLLSKFRIEHTTLIILTGVHNAPTKASWELFDDIIENCKTKVQDGVFITENELKAKHSQTSKYLRIREMLLEHSTKAGLIVMSLPNPKMESLSSALFMSWMELLTRDLPSTLFVRGTNETVIDF